MLYKLKKESAVIRPLRVEYKKLQDAREPEGLEEGFGELLENKLCIKGKQTIDIVDISTIIYCNACSNYTEIFTSSGEKFLLSKTLGWVEEKIGSKMFFRVHQSYLINLTYVKRVEKTGGFAIGLKNVDKSIPVSRANQKSINAIFSE